jgi:hypothetical protein
VSNQAAEKAPASLIQRYLPGAAVLRGYSRSWLRGDLLAGVTVAAYLVPQVMAYAEVAGLPAVAGLWASVGGSDHYPASQDRVVQSAHCALVVAHPMENND